MEGQWSEGLLPRELFTSVGYYLKCLIKATDFFCKFEKKKPNCHRSQKAKGSTVSWVVALGKVCWVTYSFQEQPLEVVYLWCAVLSFFPLNMGQRKLSRTSVSSSCSGLSHTGREWGREISLLHNSWSSSWEVLRGSERSLPIGADKS